MKQRALMFGRSSFWTCLALAAWQLSDFGGRLTATGWAQETPSDRRRALYVPPELPVVPTELEDTLPEPISLESVPDAPGSDALRTPPKWTAERPSSAADEQPPAKTRTTGTPARTASVRTTRSLQTAAPAFAEESAPELLAPNDLFAASTSSAETCCDAGDDSCDACDSMGGIQRWWWPASGHHLRCSSWYSDADLILWWRSGYDVPPLVTTSPANTSPETAGVLGLPTTQILFGNDSFSQDLSTGGRLVLGHWLDYPDGDALELRLWGAGDANQRRQFSSTDYPILARPFYDVTPGQPPAQTAQLVAYPDESTGNIALASDIESYGWELAIHRLLGCSWQTRWELIYGYQGMRVGQGLTVQSQTVVTDSDGLPPVGAILRVTDSIDSRNVFNAGMLGLRAVHRGTRWSWSSAFRLGLGGINRSQSLSGLTTTQIAGQTATEATGLLVQASNTGRFEDTEFSVSPQFDLRLIYHYSSHLDFSVGYDFIGLANVLSPGGAIDPSLAINLEQGDGGPAVPTVAFGDEFYWQNGLSLGLSWNR